MIVCNAVNLKIAYAFIRCESECYVFKSCLKLFAYCVAVVSIYLTIYLIYMNFTLHRSFDRCDCSLLWNIGIGNALMRSVKLNVIFLSVYYISFRSFCFLDIILAASNNVKMIVTACSSCYRLNFIACRIDLCAKNVCDIFSCIKCILCACNVFVCLRVKFFNVYLQRNFPIFSCASLSGKRYTLSEPVIPTP